MKVRPNMTGKAATENSTTAAEAPLWMTPNRKQNRLDLVKSFPSIKLKLIESGTGTFFFFFLNPN